ncbi:MAG: TIGR01212 family radical SAM protein [Lachnospiraceae bacterium]|jgi:radical SAM protein (TIGR01212 family)|nr:TIGR01212 family radical SAM protein [Lachnospiraceae bacterium]MCH4030024.1 TIGR01212 family radical SAM protein [Lachnospiraceae bacterium]MCH4070316.1 TIGR01212 family radical SAM protein [Lachnospiraceae bacterium]MCH4107828.1 TIGR01212 family radical SAM protein [Lachnospiraceae bacterium]MCI1361475.1 TIGR01212 family radical SAM protein [Lachnospiraceae bacterium]
MEILTLSDYLKNRYGQKVYKLALSSGCTCPNRDGSLGVGGCTFCSAGGSGEFAAPVSEAQHPDAQIEAAKAHVIQKMPAGLPPEKQKFIAYFQSYTNTYGDRDRLWTLYRHVISRPDIVILSIGTRPDCLEDDMLEMLADLNTVKPVWVELGLQTANDTTAARIHRGYPTAVFDESYRRLKSAGLTVTTHIILGLPGETKEDMLGTVRHLTALDPAPDGVKLQMLNILAGSQLADEYKVHPFPQMTMEEYCSLVVECLELLPETTVIHRMTGDGPRRLLISPSWVTDKKRVINLLRKKIEEAERT